MNVGAICTRQVDSISAGESARAAANRMLQREVGSLVVLGVDGSPVGVVTDRDVAVRVVAPGLDPEAVLVSDIMTHDPAVIAESASIREAIEAMSERNLRRLPVVGMDGRVVGVLSADDVLCEIAADLSTLGDLYRLRLKRPARGTARGRSQRNPSSAEN